MYSSLIFLNLALISDLVKATTFGVDMYTYIY
jgi:hypothetical protein